MDSVWLLTLEVPYEGSQGTWVFAGDAAGKAAAEGTIEVYKRDAGSMGDSYFTLEWVIVRTEVYNDVY